MTLGIPNTPGPGAMVHFDGGGAPIFEASYRISGITKDSTGAPLAGCVVDLFDTATDAKLDSTTSGADGSYFFDTNQGVLPKYVVAYKAGAPDVAGTTVNVLVGA